MSTADRNSAMRIAYARARSGQEAAAKLWASLAADFELPTDKQNKTLEAALKQGSGPIPGQLKIKEDE